MPITQQGPRVVKFNHRKVATLRSVSLIALASLLIFATSTVFAGTAEPVNDFETRGLVIYCAIPPVSVCC